MLVIASGHHVGRRGTVILLAFVLALDALLVAIRDEPVLITTWWSSVGLSAALLALSPLRRWPALAAAIALSPLLSGSAAGLDLRDAAVVAFSQTAQAVLAATVLTQLGRRRAGLASLDDLLRLGFAGVVAGVTAALLETTATPDGALATVEVGVQVGLQHAVSIVLFGALLLGPHQRPWRTRLQAPQRISPIVVVQTSALFVALAIVFVPDTPLPLTFLPLPFLVWGAILLDARLAAAQLLLLGAFTTITTPADPGPFNSGDVSSYLVGILTLGYVASAALITLPLAVIVAQRRILLARSAADEHLFRRSFIESPLGMLLLTVEAGRLVVTEANASALGVLGGPNGPLRDPDALEGRELADLVGTLDPRERVFEALVAHEIDTWHGPAAVLARPGSRVDLAIAAIASAHDDATIFSAQLLDQTREHESRRRLEEANTLTDATLDTAACIIVVIDGAGTVVRVNAATSGLTGHDEAAILGRPIWDTPLATLTRVETEAMFVWPNRSGVPMVRERMSYTAAGSPIRLVWNNSVVRNEAGAPSYAVLTGVDVTAERSNAGLTAHLLQASIATALIGLDVSGRITVFNAGASHMLGVAAEEMIGQPFVSILDPSQLLARTGAMGEREAFLCLVGMIGHGEESATRDWTWRTRDGHELVVSMTLSVTDDNVEERVGFLCVGRDVTQQREGQNTLVAALERERTAVERLRSLDRAKDEFVSTVSHELRTPVTSILGYTELLLDGDVVEPAPQQVTMLETIARNSHRLIAICNDLLMLSGFDARATVVNRETYDLREAVGVAEDFARTLSVHRPLTLTFEAPDAPVMVSGDRSQLDRVLVNLVSNAIKFTEDKGTVDIRLGLDVDDHAVITVSDTGMGIHPDDQDQVFQRFFRTEDAQALAIPGTGLGLAIVAGIVEAHGGSITLDSAPGVGTTFTVVLPTA